MAGRSQQMATVIYGLVDPRDGALRYVGKTKGRLRTRHLAHLCDVKRGLVFIPRHKWISGLLKIGVEPEIIEIEVVDDALWREAEQFWIAYFKFLGCILLNATDGGDGLSGYCHKAATRERQRVSALRRYASEIERQRTGAAVKQAYQNPETRQKLKGRLVSETTRKMLSE